MCVHCSKSELLVVLKQPEGLEGPTHISLITDNANHLVMHWGTCKPGADCAVVDAGAGVGDTATEAWGGAKWSAVCLDMVWQWEA